MPDNPAPMAPKKRGRPPTAPKGKQLKYGMWFSDTWSALDIELYCFRVGRTVERGGLGKVEHFWRVVAYLWAPGNPVGNRTKYFIRNPWSEEIVEELATQKYVAVGGAAYGTKSETCALWLLVSYLSDSRNTLGIILSTSLKEARKRIWGSMIDFVRAVPKNAKNPGLPLKVIDSMGLIRFESANFVASDRASIALIAAERSQAKEAIGKLIGMHNQNVIVIADELSELTASILEYALPGGNLSSNPRHQFVGLANPGSYFDPFAKLWKPKAGWASITVNSTRWETEYGVGLHFDGMRSPNVLAGRTIFPFLPTAEKIAEARNAEGGSNSLRFWRMIRGFFAPMGHENTIYSENDIIAFGGDQPAIWGDGPLIRVAALDPGFTSGGDKTWLKFGNLGLAKDGLRTLCYDKEMELVEDVTNVKENRTYQIVRQFKEACEKEGALPRNAGVDATGAGEPFCDVVDVVWSKEVYRCRAGGKASDLPVSLTDLRLGFERYYDRITELWYSGRELLRSGQLKGISSEMAAQMCVRLYGTTGAEKRLYAESKKAMKLRTGGQSPDNADAGFVMLDLCRQRLGFGARRAKGSKPQSGNWRNLRDRLLGANPRQPVNLSR